MYILISLAHSPPPKGKLLRLTVQSVAVSVQSIKAISGSVSHLMPTARGLRNPDRAASRRLRGRDRSRERHTAEVAALIAEA